MAVLPLKETRNVNLKATKELRRNRKSSVSLRQQQKQSEPPEAEENILT